ncbi:MAG: plasmid mobilization relaxosome protein MobC [Oscillospiraceae bacterium]|nr:plasmid mobilization relaxosome protein MobC [Oscillospiraceae bacterium]
MKTEKKKKNRVIRFGDDEWALVCERAKKAKTKNVTQYIRTISLYGEIKVFNFKEIDQMRSLISTIGNNVNQIAKVVNSTQSVYQKDIEDVQENIQSLRDYVTDYIDSLNYELIE